MPIIGELTEFYREEGIDVCAGLAPNHADGLPWAQFTWYCRNGTKITEHLGIALQEVYFLEHVLAAYAASRALVIGNSMGWCTLALGLLMPHGKVVAMDIASNEVMREGLALTNRIALRHCLPVRAVQGSSPQDVAAVVDAELGGSIDLAFIDGLHTNEQVVRDYVAVCAKAAPNAVFLFHDVAFCDLHAGMSEIGRLAGRMPKLLLGTPSGIAILFDEKAHPALARVVAAFAPPETAIKVVRQAAWDRRHRHLARWRRSIKKRVNRVRELS